MSLKAVVIGATGMVGSELVSQLLEDDNYESVKVLHRRSTGRKHQKLSEEIIDFDKPSTYENRVVGDVLFSAMGTTIKKAGSQEAQYKVDVSYPLAIAQEAVSNNVTTCVLVSSAGANSTSSNFYTRMKGELDDSIQDLDFQKVRILRPSILDGDRKEFRLGERIGLALMSVLRYIPVIKKYRPIHASVVAKAMRNSVHTSAKIEISTLDEIFKLANE